MRSPGCEEAIGSREGNPLAITGRDDVILKSNVDLTSGVS